MQPLYIQHATLSTPSEAIEDGSVLIADGRIQAIGRSDSISPPESARMLDASGQILVPGFVDLQLNGGFGHDFTQNPKTIWEVAAQLPQFGVTSFLPTIITSPLSQILQAQEVLASGSPKDFKGAQPLGLHLEGPFLNPGKKGAHHPDYLQTPNPAAVSEWSPDTHVRLVTLAPELPQATAVIQQLVHNGVVVSAGHSLATLSEAHRGFEAGIRYGTHLFNAMRSLNQREPGLIAALLADERVTIGLIPDGVHVHPALIKLVWQIAGGRLNLVSDSMAAMGMPPGRYQLGDFAVTVDEHASRLKDGTLAGSIITLDAAVRKFIEITGCTLAQAVATVTMTPLTLLGLDQSKGQIAQAYEADLVLLNHELEVQMTISSGEIVWERKFGVIV